MGCRDAYIRKIQRMSITLDQVTKRYQGVPVVNDVSIDIGDGEFFVLLGPSGSGKSTLLRAVAGLTGVDHGRISLHGRDVTHVPAQKRDVGLVFQNYALFRHMTIADNIEFALRVRRMRARERRERRRELLRLVALEGMDERLPTQLSGGQQQRVAVARALAHKPEVLLLDEPFGALDAKIRDELRRTIRQVQRELGITTVLVTHDQEEAFALADRIGVMNFGRLLEVGGPDELYTRPATRFVATFLGAANLLLGRHTKHGVRFGETDGTGADGAPAPREHEVVAVVRPEEIELAPEKRALACNYLASGTVEEVAFTGALERLRIRLADGTSEAQLSRAPNSDGEALLEVTRSQHEQRAFGVAPGQVVAIGVRRIHVLPTPLSSFTAYAASAAETMHLSQHPLLAKLAARMHTRVSTRVIEERAAVAGCAVVAAEPGAVERIEWLLKQGAEEVLVLPRDAGTPQRVLIHWADEAARAATLAVAASLLRHVAAEGVYVGILPTDTPDGQRPHSMRALLDARSEAQAVHGLEMRTELSFGDVAEGLAARLGEMSDQILILGISQITGIAERFQALLRAQGRSPLLLVYGRGNPHS
jgi:sulfate/thiosulfate transport system ATP-binding protein